MSEKKEMPDRFRSAMSRGSNEIVHPFDPIVNSEFFYTSVLVRIVFPALLLGNIRRPNFGWPLSAFD